MRNIFIILALTWLGVTVAVQKKVFSETQYNVNVPKEVCDNLVDAVPLPDVNYQPGVDASGQSVASADLGANPSLAMPNPIAIQMTGSSLALMGLSNKNLFLDPQVQMGWVTYYQDGRILFNGQPIGDSQQQALTELCKKHAADAAKSQNKGQSATPANQPSGQPSEQHSGQVPAGASGPSAPAPDNKAIPSNPGGYPSLAPSNPSDIVTPQK